MQDIFVTKGGIKVIRNKEEISVSEGLAEIYKHIDRAQGCILASDYEYPGRYSRWDIGFIDPPLEMISRGREFTLRALNERGKVMLGMLAPAVIQNPHVANMTWKRSGLPVLLFPCPVISSRKNAANNQVFFRYYARCVTCWPVMTST